MNTIDERWVKHVETPPGKTPSPHPLRWLRIVAYLELAIILLTIQPWNLFLPLRLRVFLLFRLWIFPSWLVFMYVGLVSWFALPLLMILLSCFSGGLTFRQRLAAVAMAIVLSAGHLALLLAIISAIP